MKCKTCKKSVKYFDISPCNAINPTTCEISNLRKLFGFFQYEAPNISSYICSYLPQEQHNELLEEMLDSWDMENYSFIAQNKKIDKYLNFKYLLDDNNLCSCCNRFICKRSIKNGYRETDLECLLRHLRNALAHGRVFVVHGGNYISILFEDRNTTGNISARIICYQTNLKKWKNLIEKKKEDNLCHN